MALRKQRHEFKNQTLSIFRVTGPTRAQPGCIEFYLLHPEGNRSTVVGFERWASEDDHATHMKGEHFQVLAQRMTDIIAEFPSVIAYKVLGA